MHIVDTMPVGHTSDAKKKTAQANASPCLCQDLFVMDGSRIFSLTALIRYSLLSVCVMSVCVYVYIISILTYGSVYIYMCVCVVITYYTNTDTV